MMLLWKPPQATLLFIVILAWFFSFCSNECRQCFLAKKNNDVWGSYLTTGVAGNLVDLGTYAFLFVGFVCHICSICAYVDPNPEGSGLVIFPIFNDDHLNLYCPFNLPQTLMVAQASYR